MSGPRSLLFMPANRADMLAKAPSYGADALIFDLEDSVPLAENPHLIARKTLVTIEDPELGRFRMPMSCRNCRRRPARSDMPDCRSASITRKSIRSGWG